MPKSQQLNLDEVKAVLRLVGEVRELGEEPGVWRRHMLAELCRVIGVKAAFVAETFIAALPRRIRVCCMTDLYHGEQHAWAIALAYVANADRSKDPFHPAIARGMGRSFTALRPAMADDRVWYHSGVYERLSRPLGVDAAIYSHVPLPDRQWAQTLMLHRDDADTPFTERHATMVQLVQEELARVWDKEAARRAKEKPVMPPRLRQTLECLADGCSEKQAATRLGLSRHTIHGYIKELHRRFGACSRGELLVRSADLRRPFCPRLAYETDARVQPARPINDILLSARRD